MAWRGLSFSHVWIAGGAGWTAWASWKLVSPGTDALPWCLWIAVSTGLGYAIQRGIKHHLDPASLPPMRRAFWDKYKAAMVAGWSTLWMIQTWWSWNALALESRIPLVTILGIVGLLYALVPGTRQGLRAYPALKIPLIASAWALATTPDHADAGLFASRWLLIAGLTLPFDVRDLVVDSSRIRTVPMVWGATTTLHLAVALLVISSLCFWLQFPPKACGLTSLVIGGQGLLAAGFLALPRTVSSLQIGSESKREWTTGFVLDGVLWLPVLASL
ncbi:MAG: hypothetical protein O2791_01890 [Bacteroidetes bacterium]|nr:hypothetical protein [Bacteroidota bacterium]